jgi:hypothetical protein
VTDQTVPPPPNDGAVPSWIDNSKAIEEESNWENEKKLKNQRNTNDMLWLKFYGWLVICLTAVFSLLFSASLISWSWHYLVSAQYHWLTPEQLSKIQSVIFSGSLGAIVTTIVRRQLDK